MSTAMSRRTLKIFCNKSTDVGTPVDRFGAAGIDAGFTVPVRLYGIPCSSNGTGGTSAGLAVGFRVGFCGILFASFLFLFEFIRAGSFRPLFLTRVDGEVTCPADRGKIMMDFFEDIHYRASGSG